MKIKENEDHLSNYIDIDILEEFLQRNYEYNNVPAGVIDLNNNILIQIGWQEICVDFFRKHSEAVKKCKESDNHIKNNIKKKGYIEYKCKHGLIDIAFPIIIENKHLANYFWGQFWIKGDETNKNFYAKLAKEYDFDEKKFMKAYKKVPVYTRKFVDEKIQKIQDEILDLVNYEEFV